LSDYETQRQRHVTGALALAPLLIEQMSWPAGRLAEHRTLRLRELVRIATERSPWYASACPEPTSTAWTRGPWPSRRC
jgi:hypothetical protein